MPWSTDALAALGRWQVLGGYLPQGASSSQQGREAHQGALLGEAAHSRHELAGMLSQSVMNFHAMRFFGGWVGGLP